MTINLKVPDVKELRPRIVVFGVGGAGGNAVNNMIQSGLQGVDFVVANTDAQALSMSSAERRVQMGTDLTEGLGAGSHPEIGQAAAEEVIDEIRDQLTGVHMAFITAGMGGGTGTGAAPVIARTARELGILTVGVVTKPFQFEGHRRFHTAEGGIREMQKHVDTLIVIPNQNLFRIANEKTTFADAFAMADQVLYSGVACITDLIVKEGLINLDFADVRAVMNEMGKAMMGTGEASGDKRAVEAAEAAISNPLLDDVSMRGARGLLISITGGCDLTLYEVDEAATRIREEVDPDANIILGATFDDALEGVIRVSVVATGIDSQAMEMEGSDDEFGTVHPQERETVRPAVRLVSGKSVNDAEDDEAASVAFGEAGVTLRPMSVGGASADLSADMEDAAADVEDEAPYIPPAGERPGRRAGLRMPRVEEFPLPAQKQMRAAEGEVADPQHDHQSKFSGFFKRLASAGLGVREAEEVEPEAGDADFRVEPDMSEGNDELAPISEIQPREKAPQPRPAATLDDGDDDHLEIPAFLRRQAN